MEQFYLNDIIFNVAGLNMSKSYMIVALLIYGNIK